jgi:hypothetical protein
LLFTGGAIEASTLQHGYKCMLLGASGASFIAQEAVDCCSFAPPVAPSVVEKGTELCSKLSVFSIQAPRVQGRG